MRFEEAGRYSRQEWIPAIGRKGQRELARSRVAIIGAGGVKSPILFYLAAAGVGSITIIDHDRIELSNLNRQILYRTADIGLPKASVAARTLAALNPEIVITPVVERAEPANFARLLAGHDLVYEGGDGAENRREFNAWAVAARQTYIHASAQFNYAYVMTVVPGASSCFECAFFDLPASHGGPVPVLGSATGVAGSVAASEGLALLLGMPPSLADEIFFYDGWENTATRIPSTPREDCRVCAGGRMKSGETAVPEEMRT